MVARMRDCELLDRYAEERAEQPLLEPAALLAEACALYEEVYKEQDRKVRDGEQTEYNVSKCNLHASNSR